MPMQTTDQWGSYLPAGIGNEQQATQATGAFRQSPWYQDWAKQQGLQFEGDAYSNPTTKLSDAQQDQLLGLAQQHGIGISPDSWHIDENGQIAKNESHVLRNIGIGAGIAGLALTGFGAAGIGPLAGAFGGAAGAGAGAGAAAAAEGGLLPSTMIGSGMLAAAPTVAESGLVGALTGGAGAGLMGAGAGLLPSTTIGNGMLAAAPTTTSSLAGGGMGFMDLLKKGYDAYKTYGSDIGQLAGSAEKDRAAGLISQARLQQMQDELAQQRARLALAAPGMEAGNATIGDILANSQDATLSGLPSYIHVPEISGGLRPSLLSANSRQLGQNMSAAALRNNATGADVPNLTPLPTSNGLDSFLQALTYGSGFMGILNKNKQAAPSQGGVGPYRGPGTPGYPGDAVSAANNPLGGAMSSPGATPEDEALYQSWLASQEAGG